MALAGLAWAKAAVAAVHSELDRSVELRYHNLKRKSGPSSVSSLAASAESSNSKQMTNLRVSMGMSVDVPAPGRELNFLFLVGKIRHQKMFAPLSLMEQNSRASDLVQTKMLNSGSKICTHRLRQRNS